MWWVNGAWLCPKCDATSREPATWMCDDDDDDGDDLIGVG